MDLRGYFEPNRIPAWKRGVDLLSASLGLILLSPVFVLLIVLIKVVSPGPAFFRQERVGLLGRSFMMLKFRTMKLDADTSNHLSQVRAEIHGDLNLEKVDNRSQLIPGGEILRKSGIDELPQLLNVLMGNMSLVGPRPELPYAVEVYQPWHYARFEAVPGITGLWQVNGKNRTTFNEMIRYDIRYCRTMSARLDLRIILGTLPTIVEQMRDEPS